MKAMTKRALLKHVLDQIEEDMADEELIHLLLEQKLSTQEDSLLDKPTFGQRAADKMAKFAGSWTFILIFSAMLIVWMIVNVYWLNNPFDPYPFILLNLLLSCTAALQAPLIMMSQNREEQKDRRRAENDYRVNLKSEIIIEDLHEKLDLLLENQQELLSRLQALEMAGGQQRPQ